MALRRRKKSEDNPPAPKPPRRTRGGQGGDDTKAKGSKRFVIIIGDDGAILVYMQGRTVVRRLFAPSPQADHTASIVELMQANPKVPLMILADVLDQQYVRHSFPPVSSLSVSGLVKRRLERDFQAEDLKSSLPLGRDKTGRREWNYLLIALANTPLIQQWMELIVELPNELKGIYLVPVEGQNYIPALKKHLGGAALQWQLLVTHNKVSGFRQIVLRDGRLVFTRVTQAIDEGVAAVIAGNIEQEIINTIEYLRRLGFQENNALEIIVITAQEVKETLDIKRFQSGSAHVLTPLDVADMLALQQAALSADRFGDVVMAAWFAHAKKRRLRFLTAYGQKLAKLYLARRAILTIGGLALLALIGMAAMNVISAMSNSSEADSINQQRVPLQSEITTLKSALDGLDKDVAFKSAVVSVYDAYLKDAVSPLDFVGALAPYVSKDYRVEKLIWAPTTAGAAPATDANGAPLAPTPLEIHVTMEFAGRYADIETLSDAADTYIALLKKEMPDYVITANPYPWMAGNTNSLEISFDQQPSANNAALQGKRTVDLTFRGPKAKTATGAVAPPGAAPSGMPGGMPGGPGT